MNDYIYLDLETNGLLPEIHTIHCMAICNTKSEPKLYVGHEQIKRVLSRLDVSRHILVAHNGCAFDLPALWKVLGFKWKGKVEDTMLMSTLDNPDGKHSLKDWGEKLNCPKDDYQERCKEQGIDPWGEYNDEMGRYCVQDVATLKKVHQALLSKLKGKNWANPLALEQAFANWFMLQGETGVQVDLDHCVPIKAQIEKEMEDIAATVEPLLPPVELNKGDMKKLTPPKIQFLKSGKPSKASYKFFDEIVEKDGWHGIKNGVEVKLPHHEPVGTNRPAMMKDDVHLKNWLMDSGWVPSYWNYKKEKDERGKLRFAKDKENNLVKASPKMTKEGQFCPSLEKLINDGGIDDSVKLAARWFILRHRLGLVKGVVSRVRSDGRVSATGHSYGTPTTRVRHVAPVCNIPKADPSILLGKEMRAMFCAKPGNVLVGVDAAGLELRCLAHYMDDESFTQTVLHGKKRDDKDYAGVDEIHTLLWEVCKEHVASRSIQKNVTYAFLYGGGDKKLGLTAGASEGDAARVGGEIRQALAVGLPKLGVLMEQCEAWGRKGRIIAIDGRHIPIRMPHATLNMLLQSCGSIIVKAATVWMCKQVYKRKLRGRMVIHMHDEVQWDCHPDDAEEIGQLFVKGMKWAERYFNIKCPLDGDVEIGHTWADTH